MPESVRNRRTADAIFVYIEFNKDLAKNLNRNQNGEPWRNGGTKTLTEWESLNFNKFHHIWVQESF